MIFTIINNYYLIVSTTETLLYSLMDEPAAMSFLSLPSISIDQSNWSMEIDGRDKNDIAAGSSISEYSKVSSIKIRLHMSSGTRVPFILSLLLKETSY